MDQLLSLSTRLRAACQSRSLLFQFFLDDFLRTKKIVDSFKLELPVLEKRLDQNPIEEEIRQFNVVLMTSLNSLVRKEFEQSYSWDGQTGSLFHLQAYCLLLTPLDPQEESLITLLQKQIHSTLHQTTFAHQLTKKIHHTPPPLTLFAAQTRLLVGLLDRLVNQIQEWLCPIALLLKGFKQDENVLWYLVSHQKELDQAYETGFTQKICKDFFEGSLEDCKRFLTHSYKKRGYSKLLSSIEEQVASL